MEDQMHMNTNSPEDNHLAVGLITKNYPKHSVPVTVWIDQTLENLTSEIKLNS